MFLIYLLDMLIVLHFVLIILFSTLLKLVASAVEVCPCSSPNVHTVLFKNIDIYKQCWSQEEMALLYARRLFQMALPKKVPMNLPLLVRYIKICLGTVRNHATSRRAHFLMMSAMADALGGYLQAFAVPLANAQYYENINMYHTTKQINELLVALKRALNTDGGGWTKAIYIRRSKAITPYIVPSPLKKNYCPNLITSFDLVGCRGNRNNQVGKVKIPLPILDDSIQPNAIAVPFKDRSLYSLFTKDSSDILIRYYTAVVHCLTRPEDLANDVGCPSSSELDKFNQDFHKWLINEVLLHLHDEDKWYAGFGGVLTLLEGLAYKGLPKPKENITDPNTLTLWTVSCSDRSHTLFYVLCVLVFLSQFWLVAFIIYCWHKQTRNKTSYTRKRSGENVVLASLEEIYQRHKMFLIFKLNESTCTQMEACSRGNEPISEECKRLNGAPHISPTVSE